MNLFVLILRVIRVSNTQYHDVEIQLSRDQYYRLSADSLCWYSVTYCK